MSKNILVVDDEQPIANALRLKLTKSGFNVQIAADGEEALQAVEKGNVDLMLLDLIMPKMDGFGVLARMKSSHPNMPIIVTSNLGQQEDVTRATALGARRYIVKSNTPIAGIVEAVKQELNLEQPNT